MAYYSGSASSFADLRTALHNALIANGWTLDDDCVNKGGAFYKIESDVLLGVYIHGGTGQAGTDLTGVPALAGRKVGIRSGSAAAVTFPVNYEIHLFEDPDEVYMFVNYNSDFYQHLSFGVSDIPGTGAFWYTGSGNLTQNLADVNYGIKVFLAIEYGTQYEGFGLGFWSQNYSGHPTNFAYTTLEGGKWIYGNNGQQGEFLGYEWQGRLVASLPSQLNDATVLLPIKAMMRRVSVETLYTAIVQPVNARLTRIDYVEPSEVLPYGSDEWKFYPALRKNTVQRNGIGWATGATHSGTLGFAIRYTGT